MPKIPVGNKGDYYWIDKWEHLFTYQYMETKKQHDALIESGITIYERMALRVKDQIPEDYWMLGVDEVEWGDKFIRIRRYWAHKDHYRFVPARESG